MPVSEAQRRANNKWAAANMTVLGCKMRKDEAERFKALCRQERTSPNAVFKRAVVSFIEEHEKKDGE